MTASEARHKTLQMANNAALLLLSRAMTAIGVPLMVFFAVQVWDDVDEIKNDQQEIEIKITKMQGDLNLLNWRIDASENSNGVWAR